MFEINIAQNGNHYAKVSLPVGTGESEAKEIFKSFSSRFPLPENWQLTLTCWQTTGREIMRIAY
jgi:hypothetical protein